MSKLFVYWSELYRTFLLHDLFVLRQKVGLYFTICFNDFTISTISRFKRLSVFLDDEGTHVVAGLVVVLVVRSVAVRELGALPAAAEHALKRQKKFYING